MRLELRRLALVPLAAIACALPTPLGELPSTSTSGGSQSDGSATVDVGIGESTIAPPPAMTSDTGTAVPPSHAFAMRYDEWSASSATSGPETGPLGTGGNSEGTGGDTGTIPEPTPDTLVVQLSTGPDDCANPHATLECGGYWTLTIFVPPERQVPGTYDLMSELSGLVTVSGDEGGQTCSFGAGTLEGTADLIEVSPQVVAGHLAPVDAFGIGTDFDFVAPRC